MTSFLRDATCMMYEDTMAIFFPTSVRIDTATHNIIMANRAWGLYHW